MFKKKLFPQKSCLGVDIGSYSIKALEASVGQDSINLTKTAARQLPSKYSQKDISNAFREMEKESGFQARDVRIGLSGPNVTVRFINMPTMSLADLKNSLKYEADKYIPFGIDEVVIDSCILSNAGENGKQMRVLLAAAKKDIVQGRIDLFKQLGYNLRLIDVDVFALFNLFSRAVKIDAEKSVSLVNIGHTYTNIIIARGGSPFFARDIRIGGEEILKAVIDQFKVSEKEAENIVFAKGERRKLVEEIIMGALNGMAEEIRLSYGYYENQFGRSVDEIFISGGWANEKLIGPYFKEVFGVSPKLWDSLKGIALGEGLDKAMVERLKPSLAVACGLLSRKELT